MRLLKLATCFLIVATGSAEAQKGSPGTYKPGERKTVAQMARTVSITPSQRLELKPKYSVQKSLRLVSDSEAVPGLIIVKFADGARVRVSNPERSASGSVDHTALTAPLDDLKVANADLDRADLAFLAERGLKREDLAGQMQLFRRILSEAPVLGWNRMHRQSDDILRGLRANSELKTGRRASDLANYYWIYLESGAKLRRIIEALNELNIVERAYRVPTASTPDIAPPTSDYTGYQDYLNNNANGIYALAARSTTGAKGDLVRIIDIESGWNLSHEDLPGFNPVPDPNSDDNDHGTAVAGILVGKDDGSGVTGIVPNATIGAISKDRRTGFGMISNISDSILDASIQLSEGDVILIEQHLMGPRKVDCTCETNDGSPRSQCGYVPVEWLDHNYDAIVAASNSGITVVEPAGNGEQDLDDSIYKNRFKRAWRDSGAIMVAGGSSSARTRECFSNHGDRIDLHGWGQNVTTVGYGDGISACNGNPACMNRLESQVGGAGDRNQFYTSRFNGTSSASPIVAGAVVAIQGVQFAYNNPPLDWLEMRDLLVTTGTPPQTGHDIGPLPNLQAAIAALNPPNTDPEDAQYKTSLLLGAEEPATDVAGLSTSNSDQRKLRGSTDALQAIERIMFAERGDRPCYIRVEQAHIEKHQTGQRKSLDECGDKGPTDKSEAYIPLLTTSHDTFINKIAVCNSKTNNHPFRLKGIGVWRTRFELEEIGKYDLVPVAGEVDYSRPNCDDNWRTPSTCPSGSVAKRIEVHLRQDGNDLSMSGLRLMCSKVIMKSICTNC